jgi:peptidyl-prolyl cis-trans isomerase D
MAMLRTMREKTKIIMLVLSVAFVGWLIFDVGMGVTGRNQGASSQDVGVVNGSPIKYQEWLEAYRVASDQERQRNPGQNLTREDQKVLEDGAFEQLVQARLLRDEYRKRSIVVTDREIVDAARRYPPEEVTSAKDFQTDGQFDPQKWQRFLASGTQPEFLSALEQRYRSELPRLKLLEQVTSDIYVADAKLWTIYRDQRDSVVLKAMVIRPDQAVADASVHVTSQDLQTYYDAHREEMSRPARAVVSYVGIPKLPEPVDSIAAVNRAHVLRDSIAKGADFAAVARAESADSGSRKDGGQLPTFGRGQMAPPFEQAAFRAPVGQVSEPVVTAFGVHLIKVEKRTADSVTARHILVPIARTGARLDSLESRADSLDRLAAEQTEPGALDSAAKRMSLGIQRGARIAQGQPVVLGRYRIPNVGIWAFEAKVGETSPVIETSGAYYVFRLDSLVPAGVPALSEVEAQVRDGVVREKKRAAAEAIARDAERRLGGGQNLDQVAAALRLPVQTIGPFARTSTVPLLGTATEAVGVAFRMRVGERSRLLSSPDGFFFVEPTRRVRADSAAWEKQKEDQRLAVIRAARQVRVQSYFESLRREARVVDRRAIVFKQGQQAGQ